MAKLVVWRRIPRATKGQGLVEFALGSLLLILLFAVALDFGRAYYTYIVVSNMAGEGAAYLAVDPDADLALAPANANRTFQRRAIYVAARVLGRVISPNNVADSDVTVNTAASARCIGTNFQVNVTYHMNDLFLPSVLGIQSLAIRSSGNSTFVNSSSRASCP